MAKKPKKTIPKLSKVKSEKSTHYVSNEKFYSEMKIYIRAVKKAQKLGEPLPRLPEYIGQCILDIATKLTNKPNFIGYDFKEEMISDAIENCITYVKNFNPRKSKNPFSYFTQICYYAFLRRIMKEKKQVYFKSKLFEQQLQKYPHMKFIRTSKNGDVENSFTDEELSRIPDFMRISKEEIDSFEQKMQKRKTPKPTLPPEVDDIVSETLPHENPDTE